MSRQRYELSKDCYIVIDGAMAKDAEIEVYTFGEKRCTLKPDTVEDMDLAMQDFRRTRVKKAAVK